MVDQKFASIPKDSGMKLRRQSPIQADGHDAVHQRWIMDGIKGESVIFAESDVTNLSDDELQSLVLSLDFAIPGSPTTVVRDSGGFAFVNLNFSG